ncbi:PLAT/LH2 domain-containing protein [Spirosoma lituiforme]
MVSIKILLKTPKKKKAGTDADVQAALRTADGGGMDWTVLDQKNVDDREQGSFDYYLFTLPSNIGQVTELRLRVKKANDNGPEWLLEAAYVHISNSKNLYKFFYNQWINPTSYTEWVVVSLKNPQILNIHNTDFGEPRPLLL